MRESPQPPPGADPRERHFLRNTAGVTSVEFLWGIGMPVIFESTFLQLFIRHLGGSNLVVGLIPTLFSIGGSLCALPAGYLTSHLRRKRTAVIAAHLVASVPVLLFGPVYALVGRGGAALPIFLVSYAGFSVGIGLLAPIWQNYLVKIFTPGRAVRALSVMMIGQSVAKIGSSFALAGIVQRSAFSVGGGALLFTFAGLAFTLGSLMFLFTREEEQGEEGGERSRSQLAYLGRVLRSALRSRGFLRLLGSDLGYVAQLGVIAFYANYATEYRGIGSAASAGLFVAAMYGGGVGSNLLLGWLDWLSLKGKLVAAAAVTLAAIGLLLAWPVLPGFLTASFLLGFARAVRVIAFFPAVKRLSGRSDATDFFVAAPILMLPVSAGLPLANGRLLDALSGMGGGSYRILFAAMAALALLGLSFTLRLEFPPGPKDPTGRPDPARTKPRPDPGKPTGRQGSSGLQPPLDGRQQLRQPLPRAGADRHRRRPFPLPLEGAGRPSPALLGRQPVQLVPDQQHGPAGGSQLGQDPVHGAHLGLRLGVGEVGHVQQQVRLLDLLQRGPEGRHQVVGQLLDEPDRVGEQRLAAAGQPDPARGGVEGGEQLVLGQHRARLRALSSELLPALV